MPTSEKKPFKIHNEWIEDVMIKRKTFLPYSGSRMRFHQKVVLKNVIKARHFSEGQEAESQQVLQQA